MKHQPFVVTLVLIMFGFLSARLNAQVSVTPKRFVFVEQLGGGPPPLLNSFFAAPFGVASGETPSPGSLPATIFVADPLNINSGVPVADFPACPGCGAEINLNSFTCPSTVSGCVTNPWKLNRPTFVAGAANGNVWISDTDNDVVVEVDPKSLTVVAFAGQGPSNVVCGGGCPPRSNSGQGNGQFFGPGPLAVDSSGNLYVADAAGAMLLAESVPSPGTNIRIQKFNSSGTFLTSWGSFCRLNADGTTAAGTCDTSAPGAMANGDGEFGLVTGIAVDLVPNVYVADQGSNRIQRFDANGTFLLKWGGLPVGSADGQFNVPAGIAVDLDQSVYVIDVFNNRIQEFDASGKFVSKGGSRGIAEAQFTNPFGVASVPPATALSCLLAGSSDCAHGFVVSEDGGPSGNNRVQFLAGRDDTDEDGITDDVDAAPNVFSNDFSNAPLGFTTTGSITDRGDQTFAIYNTLSPDPIDEIRIRTETFGGPTPLHLVFCARVAPKILFFPAGTGANIHCSTPTVLVEFGPVGFQFTGSDGTLATASLNTGDSLSVNESTSQIIDNAGNISVVVGGKSISLTPGQSAFADTTPPAATCGAADTLWHAADVSISCTASDVGSGLANPSNAAFSLSTSVPSGTETASAATGSRSVCDLAGNCTTAGPITGNMIDKKPPNITLSTPAATTYALNQAVAASYSCSDGGSGVATCAGPVANGANIDTASVGSKTFTVNSTDNVGNAAKQSVSYSVTYNICLLYDSSKSVKSGATLPIKIALCDANGNDVSSSAVVVHAVSLTQVSTGASATVEDTGNANPDNDFRFDATLGSSGGYIFNLSTRGLAGTYTLNFTVGSDPQQHSVLFQVHS